MSLGFGRSDLSIAPRYGPFASLSTCRVSRETCSQPTPAAHSLSCKLPRMIVSDTNSISDIAALAAADDAIWRPHVTVATVVPRDGRFLLVEEDVRGRVVINQPAGHLDPDESLQSAAVRETLEETGWDVELDCLLCVQQWRNPESGRHFVRFTFGAIPIQHHPTRSL